MTHKLSNVSYIIGFRETGEERKRALLFMLYWLRNHFPSMEILIVEQDSQPKLSLPQDLQVRQLFVRNGGLYNRCWAFNVAAKYTDKDIFIFSDSDVILEEQDFLACIDATDTFDAVTPNSEYAFNIAVDDLKSLRFSIHNRRVLDTFASMFLVMTRSGFFSLGGWDERFEGWGAEDNAFSHVIFNKLSSKTFHFRVFHIDHPRTLLDGNKQPMYKRNWKLSREIETLFGPALERYIEKLKLTYIGNPLKYSPENNVSQLSPSLSFVLAITTYNRLPYLKDCISSFMKTRTNLARWKIIVADDGSDDGTLAYLETLYDILDLTILHNNRTDIAHQTNTILKCLSESEYDLCFKCDDDVKFIKPGWDIAYWEVIERTGYQHLIFHDENWDPESNNKVFIRKGDLISRCHPHELQGAFFTITKEIIEKTGYFDEQCFRKRGYEHVDFSLRCCRAGFNSIATPFDLASSNDYLKLQQRDRYIRSVPLQYESLANTSALLKRKKEVISANRTYIPYNENFSNIDNEIGRLEAEVPLPVDEITNWPFGKKDSNHVRFKKADAKLYTDRGISGYLGFLIKRFYNLSIDMKLYFFARSVKKIGVFLNKVSVDLMNVDQH